MKIRQIIYASTIIVLGIIQLTPCVLILSSTIIACVLGIFYAAALAFVWSSTRIGRWFLVEWYRSTLRMEMLIFGDYTRC